MKQVFFVLIILLICFFLSALQGLASNNKLPVIDGKKAVATVNDEPITLEELNRAIASSHASRPKIATAGRIDYSDIMQRLINTRLIVLEAKNMGIDELPEIQRMVDAKNREILMDLLLEQHVANIKADEDEIVRIYQDLVREWKIKSVLFKKEEDAKKIEAELIAGKNFDEVVKKAVEWGIAEAAQEGQYIKTADLKAAVLQLVLKMEIGATSPIVSTGKHNFIIFILEGIRYPEVEEPESRREAERQALKNARFEAAKLYYRDLEAKYVKLDQNLFKTLDYEAKVPGIEELLQDKRVLVEIEGETPVTVGDFSKAVKEKFYHGLNLAIESKRVNKKKPEILRDMLQRKVLLKEALRQDLDKTEEYKYRAKEYENSVVFGAFVKKVVTPDIKLDLQELKAYYKENSDQYTPPKMMRIKSLIFDQRQEAVDAINKLKIGTDFNWLSSNAEGQVDPNTKGILKFDGRLITLKSLPADIQEVVKGAKIGDYKLYASPEGHFYVLYIYQYISPQPRPFEVVREEVAKKVYEDKLIKTVEQWADQLREYYPVKIYRADLKK